MRDLERVATIRTSDRGAFKRCRRRWALGSPLHFGRAFPQTHGYFWIGTGCHFALEDFHGYNHYKHPAEAFRAFVKAYRKLAKSSSRFNLPDDWEEQNTLGQGLMDYYVEWLEYRDPLRTYWYNGAPQCEVRIQYDLPMEMFPKKIRDAWDRIQYDATLDRVVTTDDGLWILDYKFFKSFQNNHLEYDPQVSSYCWLGHALYEEPVEGFIYQQHLKTLPSPPRVLTTGKISTDVKQQTTHRLYKHALESLYGNIDNAPPQNKKVLNQFAAEEGEERDKFIQRSRTHRTEHQLRSTGTNILLEIEDMLRPDLALYPNMTKDCSWDCSFNDICIMMEREDAWDSVLEETTIEQTQERDEWRQHLQ